jgi:hypothetical protein
VNFCKINLSWLTDRLAYFNRAGPEMAKKTLSGSKPDKFAGQII